jgi:hypothetical protein
MNKSDVQKEFVVNDLIKVLLVNDKALLEVGGDLFLQCKYLLINIPQERLNEFNQINSIDEAAALLDHSMENSEIDYEISPEEEFWAHCSNLQAWAEHDYDTRLLHSNLAFSLLRTLAYLGDETALRVYKEEAIQRFKEGSEKIRKLIISEDFFDDFSEEERELLIRSVCAEADLLFKLENEIKGKERIGIGSGLSLRVGRFSDAGSFKLEGDKIVGLHFACDSIPPSLRQFKNLKYLSVRFNSGSLPSWIGEFEKLKILRLSSCNIKILPDSFRSLISLEELSLSHNCIEKLPNSIGFLSNLVKLNLYSNRIMGVPKTIGDLAKLEYLDLGSNLLSALPSEITKLSSLKRIDIRDNKFETFPSILSGLSSIEEILYR